VEDNKMWAICWACAAVILVAAAVTCVTNTRTTAGVQTACIKAGGSWRDMACTIPANAQPKP